MNDFSPKSSNRKKALFGITIAAVAVTAITIPIVATIVEYKDSRCDLTISDNITATKDYSLKIKKGTKISELTINAKEGYTFIGWFKDIACTQEYLPDDVISKDTTIFAKYEVHRFDISLTLPQDTVLTMLKENGDVYTPEELTDVAYGTKINFKISSIDQLDDVSYFYVVHNNGKPMPTNTAGLYSFVVTEDANIVIGGRFEYESSDTDVYGNSLSSNIIAITNYTNYNEEEIVEIPEIIEGQKVQEVYNINGGDLSTQNTLITTLKLSKNVRYVSAQYLKLCTNLQTITVSSDNSAMLVNNGILYLKEKTNLTAVFCPKTAPAENITLKAETTHIDSYAFAYCNITSINIAALNNLKYIGDCAFLSTNITTITLPDSVTFIGYSAFNSCLSLTEVNLLCDSVTVGYVIAEGASGYSEVQGLSYAFANCPALSKIYWDANMNFPSINWEQILGFYNPSSYASGLFYNSGTTNGVEFKIGKNVKNFDHANIIGNSNSTYVSLGQSLKVISLIFEKGADSAFASFATTDSYRLWNSSFSDFVATWRSNVSNVYFEKDFFNADGSIATDQTFAIATSTFRTDDIIYKYDPNIDNDLYHVFTLQPKEY